MKIRGPVLVRERLVAVLVFCLLFTAGAFWINTSKTSRQREILQHTSEIAAVQAETLERNLLRSLSAATILGSFVESHEGDTSEVGRHVENIFKSLGGVTNLQIAPDGVIREIFPLQGHEKALGHNLLRDDERKKEAALAIETRKLTLAGPFSLIQGGTAVIGRQPVFVSASSPHLKFDNSKKYKGAQRGGDRFWGFTSALIDLDTVLGMTDLPNLDYRGYAYRLWRNHPDTRQPDTFAGVPQLPREGLIRQQIRLPNSVWYLEVARKAPPVSPVRLALLLAFDFGISLLVAAWIQSLLQRPRVLQTLVAQRTAEIEAANQQLIRDKQQLRKLSNAVEQSGNAVIITDRGGVIEYVNPKFTAVTGYESYEVVGRTPALLKSYTASDSEDRDLWKSLLAGESWHGERRNITKDGRFYWSLMSISPVKDDAGEITHFVSVSDDISDSKETQLKIEKLAYHDPLTGLANRRYFLDRLHQEITALERHPGMISLMFLDLDWFKDVNDRFGHDFGDAVLEVVAQRLLSCTRKTDLVARLGGDEFTVLLTNLTDPSGAMKVADDMLRSVQEPMYINGEELTISLSIGITDVNSPEHSAEELLRQADRGLYAAKGAGRNRRVIFEPGEDDKALASRI